MVTGISGTVYCNREFSLGVLARRLPSSEFIPSGHEPSPEEEWRSRMLRQHGLEASLGLLEGEAPLGLSSDLILDTRSKKGLKGLTSKARRDIRCGAFRLERRRNRYRVGFGTCTLPELSDEDYLSVHSNWGVIVNRFIKWCKRGLNRACVPDHMVYVTEIQGKRHEKTGRAYLHLHFVYLCCRRTDYTWFLPASDMRVAWNRAVSAFCSERSDFDASVDCVVVKKSVARYLAKYLGKGPESIDRAVKDGLPVEALGHWWGWTAGLRRECRCRELRADGLAEWMWRNVAALKEAGVVAYLHYVYISTPGYGDRCIGCTGLLTKEGMGVISLIHSQIKEGKFPDGW